MSDSISEQEKAARDLAQPDEPTAPSAEQPPEPEPEPDAPDDEPERKEPETREELIARLREQGPPQRAFLWVSDKNLTVDDWLAAIASADIEVFPKVVFRFVEAKSSQMREADALVNSMGPAFMLTGLMQADGKRDDIVRGEQWARARNIAMLAISVTHMAGEPWPEGKSLKEKFNVIDDLGHIKLDRLIAAFSEFTVQLAYVIEVGDLPNV